jgi:hypothetical protein
MDQHHVDADPDPDPLSIFIAYPDSEPTKNFTHVGKSDYFYF